MATIKDLPPELLSTVFEFLDYDLGPKRTLLSSALVCKYWTMPAQRALWKSPLRLTSCNARSFIDIEGTKRKLVTRNVTVGLLGAELVRELLANCWGVQRLVLESAFAGDDLDASVLQADALKGKYRSYLELSKSLVD